MFLAGVYFYCKKGLECLAIITLLGDSKRRRQVIHLFPTHHIPAWRFSEKPLIFPGELGYVIVSNRFANLGYAIILRQHQALRFMEPQSFLKLDGAE